MGRFSKAVTRPVKIMAIAFIAVASGTAITVVTSGDSGYRYVPSERIVNDITGLNPVHVARVVRPGSVEEVVAAIRSSSGPISIGGGRFSQGSQVAHPGSIHLDMRGLDKVLALDVQNRRVTVQAGITWRALQEQLDPHDLAIRIMQTYSNFTVGGSASVNVHGRYIGEGPLVRSIEGLRVVLADGSVVSASPTERPDLFYGVIGGYGGLGVIVEVTLGLAENSRIQRRVERMTVDDYPEYFRTRIRTNPDVVFHNADIYPPDFTAIRDETWYRTELPVTVDQRLIPTDREYTWGPRLAEFTARWDLGKWLRRYVFDPAYYSEDRVVWRNWEASYDVRELAAANRRESTYGLREYFVPVENFARFLPRMREIFRQHDVNVLNISIRHALPDPGSVLAWAPREVFAFVVYYQQGTDGAARDAVQAWTRAMVDAVVEAGGTYYLPYQNHATPEQFDRAYPRAQEYFALKARLDPDNRFRNQLWDRYYPANRDPLRVAKEGLTGYRRGEEQTLLTVPEWYLVFNPQEYADFLASGRNPSDFPFFDSIDEYWSLYDRVQAVSEGIGYPPNAEYETMLRVIGVSTTVEYLLKAGWENTLGRLSRAAAGGKDTPEDLLIRAAHRAYSELIYIEPWYKFPFLSWVRRVWSEPGLAEGNFLRKIERRIAFTLEFGVKAVYAKLIGLAAESAYGESEKVIYATAVLPAAAPLPAGVRVLANADGASLLAIPRWGGFTVAVPQLARLGAEFRDISGNQRMAISVIAPKGAPAASGDTEELFRSRVLSDAASERQVVMVDVALLDDALDAIAARGQVLEHLYDY